jgi:anti-anti-sigma factor
MGRGRYVVALEGRLDTDTSPQLEKELERVLSADVAAVRFELPKLSYISSMGIRVLFKAFKALRAQNAMFLVVSPQPQIAKVLEIAEALPAESVFASVEEADRYFDAMQKKVLDPTSDDS